MKISIVTTKCERCGKPLATTNRSVLGMDDMKRQFGTLCSKCVTPEEQRQILEAQGKRLAGKQ